VGRGFTIPKRFIKTFANSGTNTTDSVPIELSNGNDWHIYSVPQTLYKIHPDFDRIIAQILALDPKGFVVLLNGHHEQILIDIFVRRVKEAVPEHIKNRSFDVSRRIIFLPSLLRDDYLRFVGYSDIVLDTFPVGGGRSSLEIFATGTPIVVLYPRTSILQLTSGMYSAMGMFVPPDTRPLSKACSRTDVDTGLVAFSEDAFVTNALLIASNATRQAEIRSMILKRKAVLYIGNDGTQELRVEECHCCRHNSVIADWSRILEEASTRPRPLCRSMRSSPIPEAWRL